MEKSSYNQPKFSYFLKPVINTKPKEEFTPLLAYNYITGNSAKEATLKLRMINDVKFARVFKAANFDYCTFSGLFRKRSDQALISHSGLLCLDFDHLANVDELRSYLLADDYFETVLLFRSPSGNGLKWVIEIDTSQASHAEYFRAVANYIKQTYSVEVDQSGKDISRACFLPHDPNCFLNPKFL